MNALLWTEWIEASIESRDPNDPDVATVLCACRHESEIDRLVAEGRDLTSRWELPSVL